MVVLFVGVVELFCCT